jgi:phospholipase/carboxylesterase
MQDGLRRWYRRKTPTSFDQASIRFESQAFVAFVDGLRRDGLVVPERTLFLGYSNGANLIAASMLLHPGLIRQAVLMRAMPVLDAPPKVDLSAARVLVLTGRADQTYGPFGAMLADLLASRGATVAADTLRSGHECGEPDVVRAKAWLDTFDGGLPATADAGATRG